MPAEEFEKNRAALIAAKLSRDPNMLAESDRDWDALTARGRDFAARRDEAAALRRLTLAETAAFFAEALAPEDLEAAKSRWGFYEPVADKA